MILLRTQQANGPPGTPLLRHSGYFFWGLFGSDLFWVGIRKALICNPQLGCDI